MGKSSDYFQVSNGVRQGGVLSLILFMLIVFLSHFALVDEDVDGSFLWCTALC